MKIVNRVIVVLMVLGVRAVLLGVIAISNTAEAGMFDFGESKLEKFETCLIEGMRDQHIKMRTIIIKSCKRKNPEGYKEWKVNWNSN